MKPMTRFAKFFAVSAVAALVLLINTLPAQAGGIWADNLPKGGIWADNLPKGTTLKAALL